MSNRALPRWAAGVTLVALVVALLPADGLAVSNGPDVIPGQWIVVFADGVDPAAASADLARELGLGLNHVYKHALNGFAATVPDAKVATLRADPRIVDVVRNRVVLAFGAATGVDRIDAEDVSSVGSCSAPDFRIAILDTGIDLDHPDLNVDVANSVTFATGGAEADDHNGHGTHVAGSAAAKIGVATVGGVDVRGVAPGTCLIAVKVLGDNGKGSDSSIIAGLDYVAANADGLSISVANLSLGRAAGDDTALHTAIQNTAKAGVVIVVAAGNDSEDAADHVPAAYDEVITVSAIKDIDGSGGASGGDDDDTFASFSNFGVDVDLAAPGVDILSTYKGGGYAIGSGTSFSAPLVTGAVAERIAASALTVTTSTDPMATRDAAMAALGTKTQADSACGFAGDPDSSAEPLLYVGQPSDNCAGSTNQAPTVSAGVNQTITLPDLGNLSGTVNDDGLPDPPNTVTTTWSRVSGPGTVNFGNTAALNTTASFSTDGVYVLRLTASDSLLQDSDEITITVNPANPANQAPTVSAGVNQTITLPDLGNLSGTVNDDGLPDPPNTVTTTWSRVSGPGTVNFGNTAALNTTASFSTDGVYVLRLTASDSLLQDSDEITITVNPANPANQAPTVSAGVNQTITLPDLGNLSGTVNDDGLPDPPNTVTTTWSRVSGPGTVNFGNTAALNTTASFSTDGVYVLRLTASDSLLQDSDEITITVNPEATNRFIETISGQDEMFFYRDDGLFRYYNIKPDGTLSSPILAGTGYTTGWSSITAVDLDGDGQDEMFFYRDDGLFRYYNIKPDGTLSSPILAGTGYTTGWSSITSINLDG